MGLWLQILPKFIIKMTVLLKRAVFFYQPIPFLAESCKINRVQARDDNCEVW